MQHTGASTLQRPNCSPGQNSSDKVNQVSYSLVIVQLLRRNAFSKVEIKIFMNRSSLMDEEKPKWSNDTKSNWTIRSSNMIMSVFENCSCRLILHLLEMRGSHVVTNSSLEYVNEYRRCLEFIVSWWFFESSRGIQTSYWVGTVMSRKKGATSIVQAWSLGYAGYRVGLLSTYFKNYKCAENSHPVGPVMASSFQKVAIAASKDDNPSPASTKESGDQSVRPCPHSETLSTHDSHPNLADND